MCTWLILIKPLRPRNTSNILGLCYSGAYVAIYFSFDHTKWHVYINPCLSLHQEFTMIHQRMTKYPILVKQILIVGGKYWYNFTTLWTSKLLRTKNTGGAELQSMAVQALFDHIWPLQQKHCCQGHLSRITDWDGQLDWDFEFDCRVLSIFDSC